MKATLSPSLQLYGYARVNSDGTIAQTTPSIAVTAGSTGNYLIEPEDATIPNTQFRMVIIPLNDPTLSFGLVSLGAGPNGNGTEVEFGNQVAGTFTPKNAAFDVFVYTVGNTKATTSVP